MLKHLNIIIIAIVPLLAFESHAADETEARVLVFGGTGRLGSDITKALLHGGHDVTVFARKSSNRERLAGLPVNFVIGDVLDVASLDKALSERQFDVVVDALSRGPEGVDFYTRSADNIASSAARHAVQQIILHGSVGAGDSANQSEYQSLPPSLRRLLEAKSGGEKALIESGVTYTIIRNSHLASYGIAESGNAKLYADQSLAGSVTREGLGRLTESCVLNPDCFDKIYHAIDMTFKKKD